MNTNPKPTTPERSDAENSTSLNQLIDSLLARQSSPEATTLLLQLMSGITPGQQTGGIPISREGIKPLRHPPYRSYMATDLLTDVYPAGLETRPGFKIAISGNAKSGLMAPAITPSIDLDETEIREATLDSLSVRRNTSTIGGIPALPKALLDPRLGYDSTIKIQNRALIELSTPALRYLKDLLGMPLNMRAFMNIITSLVVKDIGNKNKTDPGGTILQWPEMTDLGIEISDMHSELSNQGQKDLDRILPHIRSWLRMVHKHSSAGMVVFEGDPFNRGLNSDPSVAELEMRIRKMHRTGHFPISKDAALSMPNHPLKPYANSIKTWNLGDWEELIAEPDLLKAAEPELKRLNQNRTVFIAAGVGEGKSTIATQIGQDRARLLGENGPGSDERFLKLGNSIISIRSGGRHVESFRADSPMNLIFEAIARSRDPLPGRPEDTLILMEVPPTILLGLPEGMSMKANMGRNERAQLLGNPPHLVQRLLANGAVFEDIRDHDREIGCISSIALSRIARGNIGAIAMPLRYSPRVKNMIDTLSQLRIKDRSEQIWSTEKIMNSLSYIYQSLTPDIKALWWMSSIANAPLLPIVREFPGELTRDNAYNPDIGAIHYLLTLHNLGVFDLQPDKKMFSRDIAQFLPDGTISYRKQAQKIDPSSPARVLVEAADHLHDGLHGSGVTNTSQFLYGLALSLQTLSKGKFN